MLTQRLFHIAQHLAGLRADDLFDVAVVVAVEDANLSDEALEAVGPVRAGEGLDEPLISASPGVATPRFE